jgi:hypothetical protein
MPQEQFDENGRIRFDLGFQQLTIVAYVGDLKVVGKAHVGVDSRVSSRRSSDYIRSFPDKRITLSDVRVYKKGSPELFDAAPFMILNIDRVDLIYAREPEEGRAGETDSLAAEEFA